MSRRNHEQRVEGVFMGRGKEPSVEDEEWSVKRVVEQKGW